MNEIIKKNGITFGVIMGLFSIVVTTLIYIINVNLFLSGWITFLKIAIYITIASILLIKTKKQLNGIFPFKDAFKTYFIAAIIGMLLATFFEVLLFNFIDPSLKETLKEMSLKFTVDLMTKLGAPAAEINKAIEKINSVDQFSIVELIKGSFTYIIFTTILGLILAAIFKSKPSYNE